MNTLLDVKNLTVTLDGEKVIENLSFQLSVGEILTILGQNGAGKSVLLRTLLGFIPYEGTIVWRKNTHIGYLPQGLSHLTVKSYPLTVKDFFALKNPCPATDEIIRFLHLVGLDGDSIDKKAGSLSGGQFQRMLIAWILISHPQVIFLDEPTTGIDIGGGDTIYSLLHTIWKKEKLTIFLVTHDLNIVYKHSSHVLCLNRKGHMCFGKPEEIMRTQTLEELFGTDIKLYEHH